MGLPLLLILLLTGKSVPQAAIIVSTDALLGKQALQQDQESDAKA